MTAAVSAGRARNWLAHLHDLRVTPSSPGKNGRTMPKSDGSDGAFTAFTNSCFKMRKACARASTARDLDSCAVVCLTRRPAEGGPVVCQTGNMLFVVKYFCTLLAPIWFWEGRFVVVFIEAGVLLHARTTRRSWSGVVAVVTAGTTAGLVLHADSFSPVLLWRHSGR